MSLRDYQRKRDFNKTREPSGRGKRSDGGNAPMFVVQLHHARRRHFDFRLQVDGVLKSWAIPKGPSFDPTVKRLAVEVEDHPLDYAGFEGDIPEGHYGAGHVDRFDHGRWQPEDDAATSLKKGHLSFELFGHRLKGHWHLVRSHRQERQPAWFLIKGKDRYAGKLEADDLLNAQMKASTQRAERKAVAKHPGKASAGARSRRQVVDEGRVITGKAGAAKDKGSARPRKLPVRTISQRASKLATAHEASIDAGFFAPQLARLVDTPPKGDEWLHEIKWDGYRLLTTIAAGEVQLWSRNQIAWNERVPEIAQALARLGLNAARFDGELIALDSQGRSDFNLLQKTLSGEASAELRYVLFDVLHVEGQDISGAPLIERKALLEDLLRRARNDRLLYSAHAIGGGDAIFAMAVEHSLEGIICKRADAAYRAGRGDDWKKVKRLASDEFAIVGYTDARGSRQGFGSLLLGRPAQQGGWDFAGRVGTGFSDAQLGSLAKRLKSAECKTPPVHPQTIDPLLRGAHWVKPAAVAEVYFRGIGNLGLLRQPSLKGLRLDKSPQSLLSEGSKQGARRSAKKGTSVVQKKVAANRKPVPDRVATTATDAIVITHPDREVYPGEGITKQDVADYYSAVMDDFLPGVAGRPVSVIRCPSGVAKACFFQKHAIDGLKHTPHARLKEGAGQSGDYLYIDTAAAVIELVQFGALEFHPWGATIDEPDRATHMIFDLDPAPDVPWARVVKGARCLRGLLQQVGLTSFVRTTGGKGLHVVVPLAPACDWDTVKHFSHSFADALARAYPDDFIAVASKQRRKGLIFVDYLRNARGATSVASYSLRSRPGAPVAVPLRWEELGKLKSGAAFDIHSVPQRLKRLRKDPWDGFDDLRQDLTKLSPPEDNS